MKKLKYKPEVVADKRSIKYVIVFQKKNNRVEASIFELLTREYKGEVYGKTKKEAMSVLRKNLNIIIYD